MKATVLEEPLLEFGNGHRHVDPRTGITTFGPADAGDNSIGTVRLGIVGTQEAIDGVRRWLDRCRDEVAAKESHLARFFVPFPGYNNDVGFFSKLEVTSRLERRLDKKALATIATLNPAEAIRKAVDLYDAELRILDEEPNCHVVLVCRPDDLPERNELVANPDRPWLKPRPEPIGFDFRDLLKARSLTMKRPIQIIRRETWDPTFKPKQREPRPAAGRSHARLEPIHSAVLQGWGPPMAHDPRVERPRHLLRRRRVLPQQRSGDRADQRRADLQRARRWGDRPRRPGYLIQRRPAAAPDASGCPESS